MSPQGQVGISGWLSWAAGRIPRNMTFCDFRIRACWPLVVVVREVFLRRGSHACDPFSEIQIATCIGKPIEAGETSPVRISYR